MKTILITLCVLTLVSTSGAVDVAKIQEVDAKAAAAFVSRDYPKAIELFTVAISLEPNAPTFYTNRALAHARLGHLEAALADCESALKIEKLSPPVPQKKLAACHHIRGIALEKAGQLYKAVAEYELAVADLDMEWQSAERLAWIYSTTDDAALRNPKKARTQYQRYSRYAPSSIESPALEAAVHAASGDFPQAIKRQQSQVAFAQNEAEQKAENAILTLYQQGKIRILKDTSVTQRL
jgi:tetratricopeptide (TPR) repeat protein